MKNFLFSNFLFCKCYCRKIGFGTCSQAVTRWRFRVSYFRATDAAKNHSYVRADETKNANKRSIDDRERKEIRVLH